MKFVLACVVLFGGMLAYAYHSDPAFFHSLASRAGDAASSVLTAPSFEREIAEGRAVIGMGDRDLVRALGEPIVKKQTQKSSGNEDQWFYAGKQITLKDGKVTQIETAELNPAAFRARREREPSYDPPVSDQQRIGR